MQLFSYLKRDVPTAFMPIALRTAKWKIGDYRRTSSGNDIGIEELGRSASEPIARSDTEREIASQRTCLEVLHRSGLSTVQRNALLLHYYLGCTVGEVASCTQVTEDGAKARIRLGMNKIRAYLRRRDRLLGRF